jgi:hypothetical protein
MTQTNGHIGLAEAGVSFAGWPRSEVELLLKTVGRFVASQTQPLKKEIEGLKSQIEELQARKFSGVHQRALSYKCGAQVTFDNGLWIAITDVDPGEVPSQSAKWQLAFRQIQPPRLPTKGGPRPETTVLERT